MPLYFAILKLMSASAVSFSKVASFDSSTFIAAASVIKSQLLLNCTNRLRDKKFQGKLILQSMDGLGLSVTTFLRKICS